MLIRLDSRNLHVDIIVGILEKYEPTTEIKEMYKKIEQLKKETQEYIFNKWGEKKIEVIVEKLKKNEKQRKEWQKYMDESYNPKLKLIIEEIKEINKLICPGFKESLGEET